MNPEDVPDEISDVARRAFSGRKPAADGTLMLPADRNPWRALDDALTAVIPAIRAAERRTVADEIEAELDRDDDGSSWFGGMSRAIEITRGEGR